MDRSQVALSDDTFSATKEFLARMPGLQDGVFGIGGLMDVADDGQDEICNANFALGNIPILVSLPGAADFDRCKFAVIQQGQYQSGGPAGGRAEFTIDGRVSNHAMLDGNIMAVGAKTGTFNGTWRELGAVAAGEKVYAQIHATAKSSFTSAVFKLQSADDSGGTNVTTRITFTTIEDLVALHATPVAGAITQTWWRLICDSFTGTSLTIYGAAGIQ